MDALRQHGAEFEIIEPAGRMIFSAPQRCIDVHASPWTSWKRKQRRLSVAEGVTSHQTRRRGTSDFLMALFQEDAWSVHAYLQKVL